MGQPIIKNGKLVVGADVEFGNNVVIDVAEEVVIGDRCTIGDNTYFGGRRVTLGSDFYGYSWEWQRLDIGRGRRNEQEAILYVGERCTFHNNKIDTKKSVHIGDDVGLSPEVAIYTHGYWMAPWDGYPNHEAGVQIRNNTIIGYRSVILAGVTITYWSVIGAQSVVVKSLDTRGGGIYAGNPAEFIRAVEPVSYYVRKRMVEELMVEYWITRGYRNLEIHKLYKITDMGLGIECFGCKFDTVNLRVLGEENEDTDDFRDFMFKKGIRFYTKRRFKQLGKKK